MSNQIIKEGPANLQKKMETVGGKLVLTSKVLIFKSHDFNIQRGETEIELTQIYVIRKCYTKFLGIFPILPNSFSVLTDVGEFRFVVFGRQQWISKIERAQEMSLKGE